MTPEDAKSLAEITAPASSEVLTPEGYERLANGEQRNLQLVQGAPLELILGRNHKVVLKRGDNGAVAISIDDIKFSQPASGGESVKTDELWFPADRQVEFYRNRDLKEIELIKSEDLTDRYFIEIPDRAVNHLGKEVDFADIKNMTDYSNMSIYIPLPLSITPQVTQVNILNGNNDELGVAVPMPQTEQAPLQREDLMVQIDVWKRLAAAEKSEGQNPLADELMAMAGDHEIGEIYKNFIKQEGADNKTAMIVAVAAFLYKEQLNAMGKEKFVAMVKGIRAAIEIGS